MRAAFVVMVQIRFLSFAKYTLFTYGAGATLKILPFAYSRELP